MKTKPTTSVFISHSHEDRSFVQKLADDLSEAGIPTWFDAEQIRPGGNFVAKLENGLADSTHVLLVISPRSLASAWVREEICEAQIASVQEEVRLIPVLIGDVEMRDIPVWLRSRLHVDFRDSARYNRHFHNLLLAFEITSGACPEVAQIRPRINAMHVLQSLGSPGYAMEVYVANPSGETFSIRQVAIHYYRANHVCYYRQPPAYRYKISMRLTPQPSALAGNATGQSDVSGQACESSGDRGRAVEGKVVNDPYYSEAAVVGPTYFDVSPRESVVVRLILDEVSVTLLDVGEGSLGGREYGGDSSGPDLTHYLDSAPKFGRFDTDSGETSVVFLDDGGRHVAGKLMDSSIHDLLLMHGPINP